MNITTIEKQIEDFLSDRQARGFSKEPHDRILPKFVSYLHENNCEPCLLTEETAKGWLAYELDCGRQGLHGKAGSIRQLGKYLSAMGKAAYVLPNKYLPYKSIFTPNIISDNDLSKLMKTADEFVFIKNRTNKCDPYTAKAIPILFRLLYTCGLRPNEGRMLKRNNIDFKTGEVKIIDTKFRKDRLIVMSSDMLDLCQRYDLWRSSQGIKSEYFFVHANNEPYSPSWLTRNVRRCWEMSNPNVPKGQLPLVRPYDFRHRFASVNIHRWIDEGKNLKQMLQYLRVYMGHTDIRHTAYYIHLIPESLSNSPGVDWEWLDSVIPEIDIWES